MSQTVPAIRPITREKPFRICFVCLGNICRSPTAEGVFQRLVKDEGFGPYFEIDSAGTSAYHLGEPANSISATLGHLAKRGLVESPRRGYWQLPKAETKPPEPETLLTPSEPPAVVLETPPVVYTDKPRVLMADLRLELMETIKAIREGRLSHEAGDAIHQLANCVADIDVHNHEKLEITTCESKLPH
jgi:hypothetical protein